MPMRTRVIGKDSDGKDVVEVWGVDLNWAHGHVKSQGVEKEYYRAQGHGDAHYVVSRDMIDGFRYWYISTHINGKTEHLVTEFMSAYEGQEVCQILESERTLVLKQPQARITKGGNDVGR